MYPLEPSERAKHPLVFMPLLFTIGIVTICLLSGPCLVAAASEATSPIPAPDTFQPDEQWECGDVYFFLVNDEVSVKLATDVDVGVGTVEIANSAIGATYTRFRVDGLDRRWDWCRDEDGGFLCAFVIGPNGDGAYYRFGPGEDRTEPSDRFSCVLIAPDEGSSDVTDDPAEAWENRTSERLEEVRRRIDRAMDDLMNSDQPGDPNQNDATRSASAPEELATTRHYQCSTILENNPVLFLESPTADGSRHATIVVQGRSMRVDYRQVGLTEHWTQGASFSIRLTPDMNAIYEDSQMGTSRFRCSLVGVSE